MLLKQHCSSNVINQNIWELILEDSTVCSFLLQILIISKSKFLVYVNLHMTSLRCIHQFLFASSCPGQQIGQEVYVVV